MTYNIDLHLWNYDFDSAKDLRKMLVRAAKKTGDPVLLALSCLDDPKSACEALDKWVEEDWDSTQATCVHAIPSCTATQAEMAYRAEHVDPRLMPLWKTLHDSAQHRV